MNKAIFQWGTTLAPLAVALLAELQGQLDARSIDLWALGSVMTGAGGSLVVALFHVARSGTEKRDAPVGGVPNPE